MLMRHAGIAEITDLIEAKLAWEVSLALQKRLGNLP